MNEIEQRLFRAGRELREIEIEAPPFELLVSRPPAARPSGWMMRVPAMLMPVLFVLGGLAVIDRSPTPDPGVTESAVVLAADAGSAVASLTPLEEIAMISSLAGGANASTGVATATADASPSSSTRVRYR